ncbi:hypothetical protein PENTCL1PPCAC_29927 [Pristionchus entomophagus]|uniref:C2H2-type domain-containing protein n=1 Tax=Pristionchus entomophagus TaxID=358040 RepID=A0AAV5UN42_9BILA|nr:hypothetical protein PENTCL1PPCAC_29927 [Pristionchus entomophagus]
MEVEELKVRYITELRKKKAVDLLMVLNRSDADPEQLKLASSFLKEKRLPVVKCSDNREASLRELTNLHLDSLKIGMDWLIKRELSPTATAAVKMEPNEAYEIMDTANSSDKKFHSSLPIFVSKSEITVSDIAVANGFCGYRNHSHITNRVKTEDEDEKDNIDLSSIYHDHKTYNENSLVSAKRGRSLGIREREGLESSAKVKRSMRSHVQEPAYAEGKIDVDEEEQEISPAIDHKRGAWSDDEESEELARLCDEGEDDSDDSRMPRNSRTKKVSPSETKPTQCDECGKSFTAAGTLRVHKLTHLEDDTAKRPYACDQCGKRFTQAGSLSVHRRMHMAKDDPRLLKFKSVWTCDICGKECRQRCTLAVHKKTHLGKEVTQEIERKKPFECGQCGRKFAKKRRCLQHEQLHSRDFPFNCKLCPRSFNIKKMYEHMNNHAKGTARVFFGEKVIRNHQCTLCPRRFRKDYDLAAHLKRHAYDTVGFSSDEDDVEVVERFFKCGKCCKSYDKRSKLRRHDAVVHGDLPHKCALCDRQYRMQSRLATHMKSVHGVEGEANSARPPAPPRSFKCEFCPSSFTSQFGLDKHKPKHAGPSSFKCSLCREEFRTFPLLDEHKKSAHDPQPYACKQCGKKFVELAELTEHKRIEKWMKAQGHGETPKH